MGYKSCFLVFSLLFATISIGQETSTETKLSKTDQQAVIELEEKQWSITSKPKPIELGLSLAANYLKNKQYAKAIELSNELLEHSDISAKIRAEVLINLIQAYHLSKNWQNSQQLSQEIERVLPNLDDNFLKSRLHKSIALFYYKQFILDKAEFHYIAAANLVKEQSSDRLAGLYQDIGVTQAQQGKLAEATKSMLTAEKIHNSLNAPVPPVLYSNLAGLSIYTKDWEQSIKYSQLAIAVSEPNTLSISRVYMNLGSAYIEMGDVDNAEKYLKLSIEIADKLGEDYPAAINNLAYLEKKMGNTEQALDSFLRVEAMHIKGGRMELAAIAKKNIGESFVILKQREKAKDYFEQAYQIYTQYKFKPKLIELYQPMIENLEALGEFQKALSLMHEYKELNDELINVESTKSIAEAKSAFELEKKQKELLESDKRLVDLEHKKLLNEKAIIELQLAQEGLKTIRLGLTLVVLALLTIGVILFRSYRFKSKSYQILARKNEEIEKQHKQLDALNRRLEQQSLEDPLTGLNNRRYFDQFFEKNIARMLRQAKDNKPFNQLIVLIDLDNFKQINDQFGHATGDLVIKRFADLLKSIGRESDVLVRWGGEEFLWLCIDTEIEEGYQLCERVRRKFAETTIEHNGHQIKPTCSLGFAPFPIWGNPKQDWDDSLKIADGALYHAKFSGRNKCEGYAAAENVLSRPDGKIDVEDLCQKGFLVKAP